MSHASVRDFAIKHLPPYGGRVLDVGSLDVNGSIRKWVNSREYIGVDIQEGEGVDQVLDATKLIETFGMGSFDLIICMEAMEHTEFWRDVIHNMKVVLKPGREIILTTRSKGFPQHNHPYDHWRYEIDDMRAIFSDFDIKTLEKDPDYPGVMLHAFKPYDWVENDLTNHKLYGMMHP